MSMIGYYLRAGEDTVNKIREGDTGILFGEENDKNLACIDKAWHAIHYIVTGCVWDIPDDNILGHLVLGGEPINDEDMGYGPARLIPAETVKLLHEALMPWDEGFFRGNFHMQDMIDNEIYPVMSDENEADFFEYVWENFDELKKFFEEAANAGENVIAFLA